MFSVSNWCFGKRRQRLRKSIVDCSIYLYESDLRLLLIKLIRSFLLDIKGICNKSLRNIAFRYQVDLKIFVIDRLYCVLRYVVDYQMASNYWRYFFILVIALCSKYIITACSFFAILNDELLSSAH